MSVLGLAAFFFPLGLLSWAALLQRENNEGIGVTANTRRWRVALHTATVGGPLVAVLSLVAFAVVLSSCNFPFGKLPASTWPYSLLVPASWLAVVCVAVGLACTLYIAVRNKGSGAVADIKVAFPIRARGPLWLGCIAGLVSGPLSAVVSVGSSGITPSLRPVCVFAVLGLALFPIALFACGALGEASGDDSAKILGKLGLEGSAIFWLMWLWLFAVGLRSP